MMSAEDNPADETQDHLWLAEIDRLRSKLVAVKAERDELIAKGEKMNQLLLGDFGINPRDCWETPQALFDEINREGKFTVDACCSHGNAKLARQPPKTAYCSDGTASMFGAIRLIAGSCLG
jgi:hypothetical protein